MRPISCFLLIAFLLLAACQTLPAEQVLVGDRITEVRFDSPLDWENYRSADGRVQFGVEDGVYRARAENGGFSWTLNAEMHTDVVIQADTRQLSDYANNAYGLMCRASPTNNGNGYYFFVSGDGHYTLRRGASTEVSPIIPWTSTDTIQQGRSINRLRIVCVEDYLAFYVNGQLVAEARDDRYLSGYAGIAAGVPEGGEVDVEFDNLRVWSAALAEATDSPAE